MPEITDAVNSYKNITNQPLFGSGAEPVCDHFIQLFNTSVSAGQYAPVPIRGTVSVLPPFFPEATTFENVYGLKMDSSFVEYNIVDCASLGGYSGTGSGD